MALFRTSNTVFQRYILFSLPFYLLLVANGVVALWGLITPRIGNPNRARVGGIALATLLLVPFAYSAWVYFDPGQYRVFNSQPDYRGVAQYLRSVAQPGDLIVVADEPALGSTVLDYYWRGEPPAALFDARDPRLPIKTGGNVYYVVSFFQNDPAFLDKLSIADSGWYDAHFARVAVLGAPPGDVSASLDRLVSLLEAENAQFQPVQTLRASLDQLEGAVAEAADGYASAGAYFGTGEEYLRTAEGYLQRGDRARAWREALISKFMRPGSPALHEWLAARLIEESRPALGVIEREVARLVDKKE
jgi:hypothetical protein